MKSQIGVILFKNRRSSIEDMAKYSFSYLAGLNQPIWTSNLSLVGQI
jgi:hypothetical protein